MPGCPTVLNVWMACFYIHPLQLTVLNTAVFPTMSTMFTSRPPFVYVFWQRTTLSSSIRILRNNIKYIVIKLTPATSLERYLSIYMYLITCHGLITPENALLWVTFNRYTNFIDGLTICGHVTESVPISASRPARSQYSCHVCQQVRQNMA